MCKQTIKHNSYLTKEILSEEILNHDLDGLRKDLLAFYEIRDSDVLNEGLKAHFPKREKLINRLIDLRVAQIEMELKERAILQNGRKIFYTVLVAAGAFILSLFQEAKPFIIETSKQTVATQAQKSEPVDSDNPVNPPENSKNQLDD